MHALTCKEENFRSRIRELDVEAGLQESAQVCSNISNWNSQKTMVDLRDTGNSAHFTRVVQPFVEDCHNSRRCMLQLLGHSVSRACTCLPTGWRTVCERVQVFSYPLISRDGTTTREYM